MRGAPEVAAVLELRGQGLGARRIAARTGLPVSTVRDWLAGRFPRHARPPAPSDCPVCGHPQHAFHELPAEYCYLLGLYLGDGCISAGPRGVYRLRIHLDLAYPGIVDECETAIRAVAPRNRVHRLLRTSNYTKGPEPSLVEVSAYSRAWPCLFPQHGPGRKHEREIKLVAWQQALVRRHARSLLRGLIHSMDAGSSTPAAVVGPARGMCSTTSRMTSSGSSRRPAPCSVSDLPSRPGLSTCPARRRWQSSTASSVPRPRTN